MASETATGSNIEIVREYRERVFNQHSPDLAAKYLAPGVTAALIWPFTTTRPRASWCSSTRPRAV
jgi:hypothetical protein